MSNPMSTVGLTVAVACAAVGCGTSVHPAASGSQLFARDCTACHALAGIGPRRSDGGDLAQVRLARPQLVQQIGIMPVRRPLTRAESERIAEYILAIQRQGSGR